MKTLEKSITAILFGVAVSIMAPHACAQSFEEARDFIVEGLRGCHGITSVRMSQDQSLEVANSNMAVCQPDNCIIKIPLKRLSGSSANTQSVTLECASGGCISVTSQPKRKPPQTENRNSVVFFCDSMNPRIKNAVDHIAKNYGQKSPF